MTSAMSTDRQPSLEVVKAAKAQLGKQLGSPAWLRGIGVGFKADGGYCVKVNVASITPEVRKGVPTRIDNVDIALEAVGEVKPH
jgi:hypothetical protein